MIPVCLKDIPVDIRVRGAMRAARTEPHKERAELLIAALYPSARTYYLPDRARPLVLRYVRHAA